MAGTAGETAAMPSVGAIAIGVACGMASVFPMGATAAFGATLGLRITRRFGLSLAAARSQRNATADITLSLPHPFFAARPRTAVPSQEGDATFVTARAAL